MSIYLIQPYNKTIRCLSLQLDTRDQKEEDYHRDQEEQEGIQRQEWCSTWKLPSEAKMEICNMYNICTKIKTIEGGQKDDQHLEKKLFFN